MTKVSSTTSWQGDFTLICKSPCRKTRIYPRPTLQSWPRFVPAHGSLIKIMNHSTQTKSSKWWLQASSLSKISIKTFGKLSWAVLSPPSSSPLSSRNTLLDYPSVPLYTPLDDVNCLVFILSHIPITQLQGYMRRLLLKPGVELFSLPTRTPWSHQRTCRTPQLGPRTRTLLWGSLRTVWTDVEQCTFNISTKMEERERWRK